MIPEIVKFGEVGVTKEEHLAMKKGHVVRRVVENMRNQDHVPVLDMFPLMDTDYWPEKELFKYEVAVYGVKVDNGWDYEGWLDGRLIGATPGTKFGQFWNLLESV